MSLSYSNALVVAIVVGATPPYALLPIFLHEASINYWNTARQYALYFDLVVK